MRNFLLNGIDNFLVSHHMTTAPLTKLPSATKTCLSVKFNKNENPQNNKVLTKKTQSSFININSLNSIIFSN